jgi:hypothetical protein
MIEPISPNGPDEKIFDPSFKASLQGRPEGEESVIQYAIPNLTRENGLVSPFFGATIYCLLLLERLD